VDKISVIGLGKLGACSAAAFSSRGCEVIGVDLNIEFVNAINNGCAPVVEPMLQEKITCSGKRLRATTDFKDALINSDITLLIVPTPSQPDGHFSSKYVEHALQELAQALKETQKKGHLFVITSTVSPGTTDRKFIPLIESISGMKVNVDFGVCYNPEFIALGSVIKDFLNPDMVLIGESDKKWGDLLQSVYEYVCENKPYFARMSLVSSEVTKISLNTFVTMKISFANMLANICERMPCSDIDDITKALGADKRISPYYLKGGISFGGPCFPRDNRAFAAFAADYGLDAKLAVATDQVNFDQVRHIVEKVHAIIGSKKASAVSILGLAYKPNTPVIEESPSIRIIRELLKQEDICIIVYDPLAMDNVRAEFGDAVLYASSAKECMAQSSITIIMTQTQEFKSIDASYITHTPTTIVDCWRMLDASKFDGKIEYLPVGAYHL
jgi:UDPglucose 6-dehydrogenase